MKCKSKIKKFVKLGSVEILLENKYIKIYTKCIKRTLKRNLGGTNE